MPAAYELNQRPPAEVALAPSRGHPHTPSLLVVADTRMAWYSKKEGACEDASWSGKPLKFPRIQEADVCGYIIAVG